MDEPHQRYHLQIKDVQQMDRVARMVRLCIYLLAQTELLATAIPNFPVIDWAGLYGSLLWLVWMIVVGVYLTRPERVRKPLTELQFSKQS